MTSTRISRTMMSAKRWMAETSTPPLSSDDNNPLLALDSLAQDL